MLLSALKPKPEIYPVSKAGSMLRNIVAVNSPAAIYLAAIQRPSVMNCPKVNASNLHMNVGPIAVGTNRCLSGFSPTESFMDQFVQVMRKSKFGSNMIYFMADNLYIASNHKGTVTYYSLDGSKMENAHTKKDANHYLNFFADQLTMTPRMRDIYLKLGSALMVGAPVLIGKSTRILPFLSSGYPHTATMNSIKMAKIVSVIIGLYNIRFDSTHLTE